MREVIIRGKRLNDETWVEGKCILVNWGDDAVYIRTDQYKNQCQKSTHEKLPMEGAEAVSPSTVGYFTGALDRNGARIFEGDVVTDHRGLYVRAEVIWHEDNMAWGLRTLGGRYYALCRERNCEIVGNVHDSPELMAQADGAV